MKTIMLMLVFASGILFANAQKEINENDDEIRTIFSKSQKN